jgi:exosortase
LLSGKPTRFSPEAIALLAALGLLWFVLCRHLSGEWSVNEQYSYGWFVPFFAIFLFWLRWEDRPQPEIGGQVSEVLHGESVLWSIKGRKLIVVTIGIATLLLLLPLRVFEIGNPDWRPLGWVHAGLVAALTLAIVWWTGGEPWLKHFAFPILFFLVAVPWVTPMERPIVQGLMRVAAVLTTEAITLLGIPAQVEGNLIRVSTGLVGVNEACSGVRSLQTSLMIGLLFGELKRLSVPHRAALVLGALSIALVANLLRAFVLVWLSATRDLAAADEWHDILGYAIVALVFLGSMFLAFRLGRSTGTVNSRQETGDQQQLSDSAPAVGRRMPHRSAPLAWSLAMVIGLAAVEIIAAAWYRSHEGDLVARREWTIKWPTDAPEYVELKIEDDLKQTLRFDSGGGATWSLANTSLPLDRNSSAPSPARRRKCLLYFFRWEPGTTTILRARAHRPDICLPSAGWRQSAEEQARIYQIAEGLALPFRHFTFVRDRAGQPPLHAHAFFCIYENLIRPSETTPVRFDPSVETKSRWASADRWRVVREGRRNPGQQVMQVILMSEKDIGGAEAEAQFENLARQLVTIKSEPPGPQNSR